MRKWLRYSTFFAISVASLLYAGLDGRRVQSIIIRSKDSNQSLDVDSIVRRLQIREGGAFSQEAFDRDLKTLGKEFEDVIPHVTDASGQVQITLTVTPRPVIQSIVWKGNRKISTTSLTHDLDITTGSLLDRAKLNEGISKIRVHYLKSGYFKARVRYSLEPNANGTTKLIILIEEGVSGKIRNLSYNGLESKELKTLKDELVLQKYSFFTSWYTGRGRYIEEALDHDKNRMIHKLQDLGFADASVDSQVQELQKQDGVAINFTASRGQPYYIHSITHHGMDDLEPAKQSELVNIKTGDLYSPGRLRKIVEKISDYYGSKGYSDIYVTYEPVLIDPVQRSYDVNFKVEPGRQYKVGMVRFAGNYTTKARVMLHESLIVPGDHLNSRKLQSTERRLMNTGYFKSVHIRTVDSKPEGFPEGDYKDIIIEVEESESTAKFGIQFGASVHNGIYGGLNATLNNFYLKGLPSIFKDGFSSIRGNGEHLSVDSSFSKNWSKYILSWTDPYFLETPWSFGVDLDSQVQRNNSDYDNYYTRSKGLSLFGYYPLNNFLRVKLSYSLRDEDTVLKGISQSKILNDQVEHSGLYNTFATALMYNSTNNLMLPSLGFRSTLGGSFTAGPANFLRAYYHNSYYYPVSENGTFKVRADFDYANSALGTAKEKIPMSQRLFLGGEDSVRGYRYNSLGPRDPGANSSSLGGLNMYVYSFEYLYRINNTVSVFAFQDNGRLGQDLGHWSPTYHSWGWGFRFDLMGKFPLVFGWGYPMKEAHDRSIVRNFFFTLGGKF